MRLLDEIYTTRRVIDAAGVEHPLHSEVTPDEGRLLTSIITEHGFSRGLEIGCAYGLSSLHICEALAGQPDPRHTIIDPFQQTEWFGTGVANLRRAGFEFFELLEQPSELALPDLLTQGRQFDFILIDGYHTFDQTLVDFYFSSRLLVDGGIIVMDDVHLPAVRRVARFVATLPNFTVVGGARPWWAPPSTRRRVVEGALRWSARLLPQTVRANAFAETLFESDGAMGIGHEMVAFRKAGHDVRGTHWDRAF